MERKKVATASGLEAGGGAAWGPGEAAHAREGRGAGDAPQLGAESLGLSDGDDHHPDGEADRAPGISTVGPGSERFHHVRGQAHEHAHGPSFVDSYCSSY